MQTRVEAIIFHGTEIPCVQNENGEVFVAVKPISDSIGLTWVQQHKTIRANPILGPASCLYTMQVGGQGREMFCLPLDYLHGWLFSINMNQVGEDARPGLMRYQRECYRALKQHFTAPKGLQDMSLRVLEMAREFLDLAEAAAEGARRARTIDVEILRLRKEKTKVLADLRKTADQMADYLETPEAYENLKNNRRMSLSYLTMEKIKMDEVWQFVRPRGMTASAEVQALLNASEARKRHLAMLAKDFNRLNRRYKVLQTNKLFRQCKKIYLQVKILA